VNAGLVARVLWQHLLGRWWASAPLQFKYTGFAWVKPWPGIWLHFHWIALGVFALFIAIGFLYRISAVLFFLSHVYFFLLDQGRYVNHLYLIGLFGLLFVFVPAHRAFSIDAWLNPKLRANRPRLGPLALSDPVGRGVFFCRHRKIDARSASGRTHACLAR
jgi:hypothetical protein